MTKKIENLFEIKLVKNTQENIYESTYNLREIIAELNK